MHTGVLGPLPFSTVTPPTLVREYLSLVAVGTRSLWDARKHGGRRPLTHSPGREVNSGPATLGVPTPRLLGDSKEWRCLSSRPCCREAVGSQSLWVASPEVLSQHPFTSDLSLCRRPSGYSRTA